MTAAETRVTVARPASPVLYGQPVRFTAAVANATRAGAVPTGTVQFVIDGHNAGGPVQLDSAGRATSDAVSGLALGHHRIEAVYTNTDGDFVGGGSGRADVTVQPAPTAVGVRPAARSTVSGQPVTFTATVRSAAAVPTGAVQFVVDGADLGGPVTLDADGRATSPAVALTAGRHTVVARFLNQDGNFLKSRSAPFTQVVRRATTDTLLAPSGTVLTLGDTVTFTATVGVVGPGAGTATGTVVFLDGSTTLGTAALSGGVARFSTSALTAGVHRITAVYSGDAEFRNGVSRVVRITVNDEGDGTS